MTDPSAYFNYIHRTTKINKCLEQHNNFQKCIDQQFPPALVDNRDKLNSNNEKITHDTSTEKKTNLLDVFFAQFFYKN